MDNDVRDQITRGRSVKAYQTTHATLFTGQKAIQLIGEVDSALTNLVALGGDQTTAADQSLAGTVGINSLLSGIWTDLVPISGTARTIEDNGFELPAEFNLPRKRDAQSILDTGEAFYRNTADPTIEAKFVEWELPADFRADLRADLDLYEGKIQNRDNSTQERKDAVAQIDAEEEKLIRAIDGLDTLMKNKLKGDKTAYNGWKNASKLIRTRVHPKPVTAKV